jgi:hypothetical protein
MGGYTRVAQTISLGSPFAGTTHAELMPVLVGRDLLPGSRVVDRIRARAAEFTVPHLSVVAARDRVVVPTESAVFPTGDVVILPGRGHNALLYDEASIAAVTDHVLRCRETALAAE